MNTRTSLRVFSKVSAPLAVIAGMLGVLHCSTSPGSSTSSCSGGSSSGASGQLPPANLVWTKGTITGVPAGITLADVSQLAAARDASGVAVFVALVSDKAFAQPGKAQYVLTSKDGKIWAFAGAIKDKLFVSPTNIVAGPTVVSERPTTIVDTFAFFGQLPDGQGAGGAYTARFSATIPATASSLNGFGLATEDTETAGLKLFGVAGKYGADGALTSLLAVGGKGDSGSFAGVTSAESLTGVIGKAVGKELPANSVLGRAVCATGNAASDPWIVVGNGAYSATTPRIMTLTRTAPNAYDVKTPLQVEGDDARNTSSSSLLGVVCGATEQIAVGRGNAIVVSKDKGTTWKLSTEGSSQVWERIVRFGNQYLIIGWKGGYAVTVNGTAPQVGVIGGSTKVDFASLATDGKIAIAGSTLVAVDGGGNKVDAQIWWTPTP
jgi:hypothetical protein